MTWDSSAPQGTVAANTLDTVIQSLKEDLNAALTANNAVLGDAGVFPGGVEPVTNPKYHYRGLKGTTAQRTALAANESGLFFDTDENKFYSYAGGSWTAVGTVGPSVIPAGTVMLFYQATAPTGWSQIGSAFSNYFINATTVAAGNGGTKTGTFNNVGTESAHTHSFSDAHTHPLSSDGIARIVLSSEIVYADIVGGAPSWSPNTAWAGDNRSAAGSFTSGIELDGATDSGTASGTTGPGSSHSHSHVQADHAYANVIICSKDAY